MTKISLIAAMAKNRVIGYQGDMPWRLPGDLKYFKTTTLGKPMIMGRKTFESLPGVLPGRRHIVITRQTDYTSDGIEIADGLGAALALAGDVDEVIVAGGGEIYKQALEIADRIYLTEVDAEPQGDTHFPDFDPDVWQEISRAAQPRGEKDSATYSFVVFERVSGT